MHEDMIFLLDIFKNILETQVFDNQRQSLHQMEVLLFKVKE